MKNCKSCKTEIDANATKCPHCQTDQRSWFRRHPILTALLVCLIIGMIGTAVSGGGSSKPTSSNEAASAVSTGTEAAPTETQTTPTNEVAAVITVTTTEFISEFDKTQLAAEEKYKGK